MGLGALVERLSRGAETASQSRRAVIDIGSNSLRLVVWDGPPRCPVVLLNEKVAANLGRTLSRDGLLPRKAIEVALRGLARFALLLRLLDVEVTRTVATAAVREASNGAAFLDRVRALGLSPELLSGVEEAEASAMGVLSAFPQVSGIVGDLGGGSLELVEVGGGEVGRGDSFPWGTLRLPELRAKSPAAFERTIRAGLEQSGWLGAGRGRDLYLVGGSWRALTLLAMHEDASPLVDPHGYGLSPDRIAELAATLAGPKAQALREVPRLPNARIADLPAAAALLDTIVRHIRPRALVTSGFGLREGLLYAALDPAARALDPLVVGIRQEARHSAASIEQGEQLARWIAPPFGQESAADARLRLAACLLATMVEAAGREARAQRGMELALHERRIGLTAAERAMIAAALLIEAGEKALPPQLGLLCDADRLARALRWGHTMRLARKLSGGAASVLARSAITVADGALRLAIDPALAALYGDAAEQQHRTLADLLGLTARIDR